MHRLSSLMMTITDHSDTLISKATAWVGVSLSSAGVAIGVVDINKGKGSEGVSPEVIDTINVVTSSWNDNVGMYCGIGGFLCLSIRTAFSIYLDIRKQKREQAKEKREQELHAHKLNIDS